MLQSLAVETAAQTWAIASMLFFLLAFLVATALVWRTSPAVLDACSRLPLDGQEEEAPCRRSNSSGATRPDTL